MTTQARKGWFKIPGVQDGDRTLAEQMKGLEAALAEAAGKSLIDYGTAEGLVAREFAQAGATRVVGTEIIAEHIEVAKKLCAGLPVELYVHNLNTIGAEAIAEATPLQFDIALALAILHKLRRPEDLIAYICKTTRELVVVRLPSGSSGVIVDARSKLRPIDVVQLFAAGGFALERSIDGPRREQVCYFRRKR
jgi:hypothetical protein